MERRHVIVGDRAGSGGCRLLLRLRSGDAHIVDGCLRRCAVASANSARQVRVTMITANSYIVQTMIYCNRIACNCIIMLAVSQNKTNNN